MPEELALHFLVADPVGLSLAPNHAADPIPFHNARKDRVDPDPKRPQFHSKGLGEAHHRPLGCCIGRAEGKAETSRSGREINNRGVVALAQGPDGPTGAVEMPGDVDLERSIPVPCVS